MFNRKIKIIHKLIIPPASALFIGLLFIFLIVSAIDTVQQKIYNLEQNLIPLVEKSTNNITQLKNISEKFVFAILASEIDMLPSKQDAIHIENNLQAMIENKKLDLDKYNNIVKAFRKYFTLAIDQAKDMILHTTIMTSTSKTSDLMEQYRHIETDFLNIDMYLKKMILAHTSDVEEITSQIIYFTVIFMFVFSFFLFSVSYVIYNDFGNKFKILQQKLVELDVVSREDENINLNFDELSVLSMKINDKINKFKTLEKEKSQIENIANRDPLTNLYNRRYIETIQSHIQEEQMPFGVIILDIDFFKQINDNYGHDTGDHILIDFAKILRDSTRSDDIVIRYGGEEFVIIMQNISKMMLFENSERLRKTIEMTPFTKVGKVTASFGLACHTGNYDIYESIKCADIALYQAKESGRNMVKLYEV